MPPHWSGTSISTRREDTGSSQGEHSAESHQRFPEFSAGGVVVRGDEVVVIVPVKRDARGQRVLGLPKGHLDGDESPEEAATREVAEETGLQAELVEPLGEIRYSYERAGRTCGKRVAYFLFEFRSGSLADHDHEIEDARWMPLVEAVKALSYPGERQVVGRALSRLFEDR
ncbi:MAG: NUDIX hydrolase [Solirubrobacteraceae bacterium]